MPAVGLGLAAIGQNRIEYMCPKAGLCSMPAAPMAIAEQRVQPPVCGTAGGKIVDQLDMAVAAVQCLDPGDLVEVERHTMCPRQPAEAVTEDLVPLGIVDQRGD